MFWYGSIIVYRVIICILILPNKMNFANKLPAKFAMFRLVGIPRFELGLNPPEGLVLPLHYIPLKI